MAPDAAAPPRAVPSLENTSTAPDLRYAAAVMQSAERAALSRSRGMPGLALQAPGTAKGRTRGPGSDKNLRRGRGQRAAIATYRTRCVKQRRVTLSPFRRLEVHV